MLSINDRSAWSGAFHSRPGTEWEEPEVFCPLVQAQRLAKERPTRAITAWLLTGYILAIPSLSLAIEPSYVNQMLDSPPFVFGTWIIQPGQVLLAVNVGALLA